MSPVYNRIDIKGYRVLECERQDQLYIHLAPSTRGRVLCPCCGGVRLRSKGSYRRRARHLDCLGTPSVLIIHTRRFVCLDCRRSFIPPLPGILPGRHSTEPFRERVFLQHHEGIPASSMARLQRIGAATVSRIYAQFTRRKAAERTSLQCPVILGIDEHTLHKGQRFATTFCDLKNHRVFDVVQGRSGTDIAAFLASLHGRERVRVVCIDLSSPYRAAIRKWFPNAKIVADRFHVIRVVIQHFMNLARQIAPQIKNHSGSLAALRMNPANLTQRRKLLLERLFAAHPALEPLYDEMQRLRTLLNRKHQSRRSCKPLTRELLGFIERLARSSFEPLETLANTLRSWAEPIACMWRFSKNNGITEGFHRKMKLIQRRAYGFRNFENYRLRVIAHCG
jgi:transposase